MGGSFLSIIGFRLPVFEGEDFTLPIFISKKGSLHSNVVTDRVRKIASIWFATNLALACRPQSTQRRSACPCRPFALGGWQAGVGLLVLLHRVGEARANFHLLLLLYDKGGGLQHAVQLTGAAVAAAGATGAAGIIAIGKAQTQAEARWG